MKKIVCSICNESVNYNEYRYHMTKYHSKTVVEKKEKLSEITIYHINNYTPYNFYENILISCEICKNTKIKLSRLRKHYKEVHGIDVEDPRQKKITDMNKLERKRHLNRLLYPDKKKPIKDIFDKKGMVVSGGGFGVGKKKK